MKTPVSILHEYCITRKEIPKFDLLLEEKTSKAETLITYEITLLGEYATGSGTSKKVAKHETARALLQLLAEKDSQLKSFLKENGLDDNTPIETPYESHQSENFVGKLHLLTLVNNFPSPCYVQKYEEGMSHNKTFTWNCKVGTLSIEASHRTKKQAKHTAAMLMIEQLETIFNGEDISNVPEDFKINYKEKNELSLERDMVRAHLIGKNIESKGVKSSAVALSKVHRVMREPYLEVVLTVQKILDRIGMTADQFNSFLDSGDLDFIDESINDFLKEFTDSTGIEIDYATLPLGANKLINIETSQDSLVNSPIEIDEILTNISEIDLNASTDSPNEIDEILPNISEIDINASTDSPSEIDETLSNISEIDSNMLNEKLCDKLNEIGENENNSTETADNTCNTNTKGTLVFVTCKVYINPVMSFMGISSSFEESKRKAAILFLKYIISFESKNSRGIYFFENFSSGDEEETAES